MIDLSEVDGTILKGNGGAFGASGEGALGGLAVLEFGEHIAGPMLGMLLADQGASVIKVERPGGDRAREFAAFATWNRGKRSVVLDLTTPHDRAAAESLIGQAAVVIENLAPGVADRLGVGYARAQQLNPLIIYCSLPGFGTADPHRSEMTSDPLVSALVGLHSNGLTGRDEVIYNPLPLPSVFAAMIGAGAVTAALVARERFGFGQYIEAPLYSAAFAALAPHLVRVDGAQTTRPALPLAEQYQCSDGRYVQLIGGDRERFLVALLEAAGRTDWITELKSGEQEYTPANAEFWRARLATLFATRTAIDWGQLGEPGSAMCYTCQFVEEWLTNEHARLAEVLVDVDDTCHGQMKQPGLAVRALRSRGRIRSPAPTLDEHRAEVLSALAPVSRAEPPAAPIAAELPLSGIRVLDLSIVIAGPSCGKMLAEFGADVIKIDDPRRPVDRHYIDLNRGKRSVVVDLKTEEGKEVMWRLIESADVIIENFREGKLAKLGFGYDAVAERNPRLVYMSLNAFGYGGPWSTLPGFDKTVQAATGQQMWLGADKGKPLALEVQVNDCGAGSLATYGIMLGLYYRLRTGQGQHLDTSLVQASMLMQSCRLADQYEHRRSTQSGIFGPTPLARLYRASDDWLCLYADAHWQELVELEAFSSLGVDGRFGTPTARCANAGALADALTQIFASESRQHWLAQLRHARIPSAERVTIPELDGSSELRNAGLIVSRHDSSGREIHQLGTATVTLSVTPKRLGALPSTRGADTRAILQELGYDSSMIDKMFATHAVGDPSGQPSTDSPRCLTGGRLVRTEEVL